ncbi:MAG: chemotaxis protein CheW [Candidatus Sulfotelmatobacter sp.]
MSESDIVKDFLIESYENLDRLDRDLVGLEKNPRDKEALAGVFRTIHTIKGTCGFLGFNKLEKVAHVGENLLTRLRDGQLTLNPEITTALLGMVDAIRLMLKAVQSTGHDGEVDYPELRETLTRLQNPSASETERKPAAAIQPAQPDSQSPAKQLVSVPSKDAQPAAIEKISSELVEASVAADSSDGQHSELAKQEEVAPAPALESRPRDSATETIRVGVDVLDKLMTLGGELVLARNQVLQFANRIKDTSFLAASQRLNLITTELQEGVMKTRMQPIGNIWGQFPRTVRDVALGCGKEVHIEMEGKETELDKTIIEAIKDPLTHLVRNSVDHGIELPEERVKLGKDRSGRLVLRAFHEGGQVNIEISDDGAGLNVDRIRKKAVERALITPEHAPRMTEREIFNLIFLPGFSTAEKVTNVSGRGVGMDVVKTNVEKIGGTVDVQSTLGKGTTVRVKIPLTLAIIPALVVTCGGDRYAIPQVSLLELVRLEADEVGKGIEMVQGAPVHRLRGRLLPLVYLSRVLELAGAAEPLSPAGNAVNIVVLQAEGRPFGLVVDEINDTEEIVVKPLGKQLKGVNTFAGATIMGDGKVALILDALGLAQKANVISEQQDRAVAAKEASSGEKTAGDRQTLLLFQTGKNGRMAVPLSLVARLEEFAVSKVENTGQQQVVQYRGQIMPLIRISEAVDLPEGETDKTAVDPQAPLQVVVYVEQGRSVGLVVERILDIVDEEIVLDRMAERAGILGTAVVQKRVTDMLDVQGVVRASHPGFFTEAAKAAAAG